MSCTASFYGASQLEAHFEEQSSVNSPSFPQDGHDPAEVSGFIDESYFSATNVEDSDHTEESYDSDATVVDSDGSRSHYCRVATPTLSCHCHATPHESSPSPGSPIRENQKHGCNCDQMSREPPLITKGSHILDCCARRSVLVEKEGGGFRDVVLELPARKAKKRLFYDTCFDFEFSRFPAPEVLYQCSNRVDYWVGWDGKAVADPKPVDCSDTVSINRPAWLWNTALMNKLGEHHPLTFWLLVESWAMGPDGSPIHIYKRIDVCDPSNPSNPSACLEEMISLASKGLSIVDVVMNVAPDGNKGVNAIAPICEEHKFVMKRISYNSVVIA